MLLKESTSKERLLKMLWTGAAVAGSGWGCREVLERPSWNRFS